MERWVRKALAISASDESRGKARGWLWNCRCRIRPWEGWDDFDMIQARR